ncbi:MAG TPA: class I SAM-dependent methyltransferase [Candidatus Eremiobacteraceae bacterium]|nr:class I SAM-dependent methyltransferase [Candidatus Eremiobacteraceae bacterium]
MSVQPTRLYGELADWFHLLTAPEEYAEEAEFYVRRFTEAIGMPPRTLLELGSGGGNMASHYKAGVTATLTDISPSMLAVSEQINPECEHIAGDMRSMRLGREFDAVLVHDAVCYMTTLDDLYRAMATAFIHCRPGGTAIFAPDDLRETFRSRTNHGGHDGPDRSLRYLEWTTDPDPSDTTYVTDYAYMLREREKPLRVERDSHVCGLFSEAQWLRGLEAAGFDPVTQMQGPAEPTHDYRVFIAVRPRTAAHRSRR